MFNSNVNVLNVLSPFSMKISMCYQGRRRVFKSGPAEEAVECRRHEMGESTRSLGGFGGPPPRKFLNFERFYVLI